MTEDEILVAMERMTREEFLRSRGFFDVDGFASAMTRKHWRVVDRLVGLMRPSDFSALSVNRETRLISLYSSSGIPDGLVTKILTKAARSPKSWTTRETSGDPAFMRFIYPKWREGDPSHMIREAIRLAPPEVHKFKEWIAFVNARE